MRFGWLALELRMELNGNEPRMIRHLDDFHQRAVRAGRGNQHTMRFKLIAVRIVEFIAVPMPFPNCFAIVTLQRLAVRVETRLLCAQSHRAPFVGNRLLFIQQADHRVPGVLVEFRRMRSIKTDHVPAKLDDRALHAKTDAKEWNAALASETNRFDFAFNSAFAEASRHEHAIEAGQQPFGPVALDQLALDAL